MKMTQVMDGVIELGSDGAFDLDSTPPPPPSPKLVESPSPSPSVGGSEVGKDDWEIKKQRGNAAFSEGNLELSIDCYTAAIASITALIERNREPGVTPASILRPSKVALLSNRALCFLKSAEDAESAAGHAAASIRPPSSSAGVMIWTPSSASSMAHQAGLALPTRTSRRFWRRCERDASAALELDPGHAKALFRRSRALMALGEHSKALQAARLAKRAAPRAKEIVSWEAWSRALETEREATTAATVTGKRSVEQGDAGSSSMGGGGPATSSQRGAGDASGAVAEQACLAAAAAYLHVLGTTATHTNSTSGFSRASAKRNKASPPNGVAWGPSEQSGGGGSSSSSSSSAWSKDWRRGPRDATEGALFAACRSVALALHDRVSSSPSQAGGLSASSTEGVAKLCQDVAGAAARVARGGLVTLLPAHDPRRQRSTAASEGLEDEAESSASGAALRALRATMAALLTPLDAPSTAPGEKGHCDDDDDADDDGENDDAAGGGEAAAAEAAAAAVGGPGLVPEEAALQAGAAAAFTASLLQGSGAVGSSQKASPAASAEHARLALIRGAGLDAAAARDVAASLLPGNEGENAEQSEGGRPKFLPCARFEGRKAGYVFGTRRDHESGRSRTGYHLDDGPEGAAERARRAGGKREKKGGGSSVSEAFEDPNHPMMASLPSDEAREGVRRLLRMSDQELKQLPLEQQEQVAKIKDLYQQQAEFAKQSEAAAKVRSQQQGGGGGGGLDDSDVALGRDGKPLLGPDGKPIRKSHNPRDGPYAAGDEASGIEPGSMADEELARIRAGGVVNPGGAGAAAAAAKQQNLTAEQKLAKRRADELKWLEEFSSKEAKRQQALLTHGVAGEKLLPKPKPPPPATHASTPTTTASATVDAAAAPPSKGSAETRLGGDAGKSTSAAAAALTPGGDTSTPVTSPAEVVTTRVEWEAADARRRAKAEEAKKAEGEARRKAAAAEIQEMRRASALSGTRGGREQNKGPASRGAKSAAVAEIGVGVASEAGNALDKKRRSKAKKITKKDRSEQLDDVRRLAQSASLLNFAD